MGQSFHLGDRNTAHGNQADDEIYRDQPVETPESAEFLLGRDRGPVSSEGLGPPTPQEPDAISRAKYWLTDMWSQHRSILLVVLGLVVGIAAFAGWNRLNSSPGDEPTETIGSLIPFAEPVVTAAPPKPVVVHITGAVESPGVYQLTSADRMFNLVEAAGGFLETADTGALNLAQTLVDGTLICVPEADAEETAICRTQPIQVQSSQTATALIDPNTASAIELERLNGIGPAMSARIVEWREQNGEFRTAEDLLAIPGIGPATLDRFRSQLSLP